MNILAVESSCDDISWALVKDGREILSIGIVSQVDIHAITGGVVPEIAAREHTVTIVPTLASVMKDQSWDNVDAIAVTAGPGLLGSLLVGITGAQTLAIMRGKPLIPVHHIQGHVYANWLERDPADIQYPAIVLTVSGGHNDLYRMDGPGKFEHLGQTQDDAAGEAFDKVARLVGLSYPGGPAIENYIVEHKELLESVPNPFRFPRARTANPLDWSFSGVKSDVRRTVEQIQARGEWSDLTRVQVVSAFVEAVIDVLSKNAWKAVFAEKAKTLLVTGGVSASTPLREHMENEGKKHGVPVLFPVKKLYSTDNAAMIGAAAYMLQAHSPKSVLRSREDILALQPALRYGLT